MPVLAVGEVPELDGSAGSKSTARSCPPRTASRRRPRPVGADRLKPVDQQVVRVDREEQRAATGRSSRPGRVLGRDPARSAAARRDPCPPSSAIVSAPSTSSIQPPCQAPSGVEVAAEVVRRQLVELRVDARAVVALAVVLGDELPVGGDVVRRSASPTGACSCRSPKPAKCSTGRPAGPRAAAATASSARLRNTKPCHVAQRISVQAERRRG